MIDRVAGAVTSDMGRVSNRKETKQDRPGADEQPGSKKGNDFTHCTFNVTSEECTASPISPEAVSAIKKIESTKFGSKLLNAVRLQNEKIELARVDDVSAGLWSGVDGNRIYYHPTSFAEGKSIAGDQMDTMSLDVFFVHEIGHTYIGSRALGLKKVEVPESTITADQNGGVTITIPSSRASEFQAIRYYENPYRRDRKLPLRSSYFKVNDVPTPLIGEMP